MRVHEPLATTPDAERASRAIGAMFYGTFGGAWIALWAWRSFGSRAAVLGVVAAVTLCLVAYVHARYRQHRAALRRESPSAAKASRDRWFHAINAGQWVAILVVGNVLANIGRSAWVIPAAMFIIGLRFLPLARLFGNPPHYVTGVLLMLLATTYPFVAPHGASSPIGALGAGVVLWASALWAVRT